MKKLILFVSGLLFLCSAYAQEHPKNIIGVQAGYNVSWATTFGVSSSVKHGYVIGVTDRVLLNDKIPFYFGTGVNFIAKGYEIHGYDDSRTRFNYLQIPLNIDYRIRTGRHVTIEPAAGLWYAVGIGGNRKTAGGTAKVFSDGSTSRHDFGISCGVSTSIYRFTLGISYEAGLLNIDKADKVYGDDSPMLGYKKLRNNSIIIKAGINF